MKSFLTASIAWRYLWSKKSHGAVGTISTVSVCAMAVATAAIVCVLSVFNGFRREIGMRLDSLVADIEVTPTRGKTFPETSALLKILSGTEGVDIATPTLSENALLLFEGQEMPVKIKGVEAEDYAKVTGIRKLIRQDYGTYLDRPGNSAAGDVSGAVIAIGVASRLRAYPESRMLIFVPKREGRVNMANPMNSFVTDSLEVKGIYISEQSQFDDDGVILPIGVARDLLQYGGEATAIEIKVKPGFEDSEVAGRIQNALGSGYRVKDRLRHQEMNFRMINIEKWVSFLLLGFILVIASFNIISSLSMMVIEKEKALSTFSSLGLTRGKIGRIFAWESLYVCIFGGFTGIILGVILCLLQETFGLIKIGGSEGATIIRVYPVELVWSDILITAVPILLIGAATALVTAMFAKSRISRI